MHAFMNELCQSWLYASHISCRYSSANLKLIILSQGILRLEHVLRATVVSL